MPAAERFGAPAAPRAAPTAERRVAPPELESVERSLMRLSDWGESRRWTGTDPYDGLNATRLTGPIASSPLGRRLIIQAVKRSPVDLRPLLGIPRVLNAAALAQVASSYARGRFLPEEERSLRLRKAIELLEGTRSPEFAEPCWGYPFDVET